MVSLAVALYSSASVPFFLLVDADPADFDPRPAVRRSLESGRLVPVWQAAVHAGHDLNWAIASGQRAGRHSLRETALSAAALLMLLAPAPSESAR